MGPEIVRGQFEFFADHELLDVINVDVDGSLAPLPATRNIKEPLRVLIQKEVLDKSLPGLSSLLAGEVEIDTVRYKTVLDMVDGVFICSHLE